MLMSQTNSDTMLLWLFWSAKSPFQFASSPSSRKLCQHRNWSAASSDLLASGWDGSASLVVVKEQVWSIERGSGNYSPLGMVWCGVVLSRPQIIMAGRYKSWETHDLSFLLIDIVLQRPFKLHCILSYSHIFFEYILTQTVTTYWTVAMPNIKEYQIHVPDEELNRLRQKLELTDFPTHEIEEAEWKYGSPLFVFLILFFKTPLITTV